MSEVFSTDSERFTVGEVFAAAVAFTEENIPAMATLLGDTNPIHHAVDPRYGVLIACGGHIAGRVMSIAAASVTTRAPASLGRNWHMRFRAPVFAGDVMQVEWRVISLAPHPRGTLVTFDGTGTVQRGDATILALTASGDAVLLGPDPDAVR